MENYKLLNPIRRSSLHENEQSNEGRRTELIGKCHNDIVWIILTGDVAKEAREIQLFSYGESSSCSLIQKMRLPTIGEELDQKFILLKRWSCLLTMCASLRLITITACKFDKETGKLELLNFIELQRPNEEVFVSHTPPSWSLSFDGHILVIVEQIDSTPKKKQRPGFHIHKISINNPYTTQSTILDCYKETRSISFEQLCRVGYSRHEASKPYLDCHLINNGRELLIVKSSPMQRYLSSQTLSTFLLYDMNGEGVVITSLQRPSAELGYIVTKTKETKHDYIIRSSQSESFEVMPLKSTAFGVKSQLLTLNGLGLPSDKRIVKVTTHNGCLFVFYRESCFMVSYERLEGHAEGMMLKFDLQTFGSDPLTNRFIPSYFTDFDGYQVSVFRVLPTKRRVNQLEIFQIRSCNTLYKLCCRCVNIFFQSNRIKLLNLPLKIKKDLIAS